MSQGLLETHDFTFKAFCFGRVVKLKGLTEGQRTISPNANGDTPC